MNDEASSSAAPHNLSPRAAAAERRGPGDAGEDGERAPATAAELAERRKKTRDVFNRKRGDLLDDLLRNLDILVYAELSVIYYMDCSFLRFLLRAFLHFVSLTPKPAPFPEHPADRPALGGLVGSTLLCLICHIWFAPPSAGEVSRGYLHGGLAMDFIGQKGPVGKVELVGLDLLVLALQVVQLAGGMVRRRLRSAGEEVSSVSENENDNSITAQDLDAEERGVHRPTEQQQERQEGEAIELQNLNPPTNTTTDAAASESSSAQSTLLTTTLPPNSADETLLFDAFSTGQIVLADLDIPRCMREQMRMLKNPPSRAMGSGFEGNRSFRAELAARVLRMRMGTDALRDSL